VEVELGPEEGLPKKCVVNLDTIVTIRKDLLIERIVLLRGEKIDRIDSTPELCELMKKGFQEVKLYGGFPVDRTGTKSEIISLIKRLAVKFHLIPGSLKTRAYLKRIFMGKLVPSPPEVYEGMAPYEPPAEIPPDKICKDFKIIYAVGKK